MRKSEKNLMRLLTLLLCLPILLCATISVAAMAESGIIDPETYDGQVILEDPALMGDVEDDLGDVGQDPTTTTTPATDAPTQAPTTEPTDAPTQEPTAEPTTAPTDAPTAAPTAPPTEPPAASFDIAMAVPKGWYLNRAAMEVTVTDVGGTGWKNIKITMGNATLINGALPSGHVWLDLLDNCTVEVTVTDPYGKEHKKSETISCFDKERPTLKTSVKGEYLNIEATDAHSGIASVQVNGTNYTSLKDGKLEIHLKGYADAYEQLLVQAVDKVGNASKAIAVANPFFHNIPTVTAKPTNTPKPTNPPKPTKQPSGGGSGSGSGGSSGGGSGNKATPTPTVIPTIAPMLTPIATFAPILTEVQPGTPFSYGGNSFTRDLLYDKHTNKQFIAIETRNGDVFYMVIDYDKPLDEKGERYETYFLNLVDSRDLLDIVDEDVIEPEIVYVTPQPTALPTQAPATQEAPPKDSGNGAALGMVGILLAAAGGAIWYFKLRKQGGKGKQPYEKDYEFEDDDEEEETVNEDE